MNRSKKEGEDPQESFHRSADSSVGQYRLEGSSPFSKRSQEGEGSRHKERGFEPAVPPLAAVGSRTVTSLFLCLR